MSILAIDTSSQTTCALVADGQLIGEQHVTAAGVHAEQLMPAIAQLLSETGATRTDLRAIAVSAGPAPYTGLRIGMMTAMTIASSLQIDLWPVNSLDAMAYGIYARELVVPDAPLAVLTDAKRKQVFVRRYTGAGFVPNIDHRVATPAQVLADNARETSQEASEMPLPAFGAGALLYQEQLEAEKTVQVRTEFAHAQLLDLALFAERSASQGTLAAPEPLYLRSPDVHEPKGA